MLKITGNTYYSYQTTDTCLNVKQQIPSQVAMDCLPVGWLDRRLRLFLLLLLFLLQNKNVWILPNHFLLWIHGRLQFGPWDALWHGE